MKLLILLFFALACFAQTQRPVILTWVDTRNPAGTAYNVYRATGLCSGTPVFSRIATGITVKTHEDQVVVGTYCYAVTAALNNIESGQSNNASFTAQPFDPTNLVVQPKQITTP